MAPQTLDPKPLSRTLFHFKGWKQVYDHALELTQTRQALTPSCPSFHQL